MITLAGDDIIAQLHQRIGSREVKLSVRHLPGKVFLPLVMALLLHSLLTSTAWAERQHKVLVLYDENTDFPGLELTLTDDGQGFDLPTARGRGGLGLLSLDERVRLVGGSVQINTQLQRGTELRVQVPLDGHKDAPHG
jgi:signal transduction histidine kinase